MERLILSAASGLRLRVAVSVALLFLVCASGGADGAVLSFNSGMSFFNATHNPGTNTLGPTHTGSTVASANLPIGLPTATNTFNSTISFDSSGTLDGFTNAHAGVAESTGATGIVSFASGMGVGQTDPGHKQSTSSLVVNFNAVWNVNSTFGPPLNGTISVPIGEHVGATGSASFGMDVHWDVIHNGTTIHDARSAYILPTQNYGVNTNHLYAYSAPAGAFSLPLLTAGDQFIMLGTLTFTANNDSEPTWVGLPDPSNASEFKLDIDQGQDPNDFTFTPQMTMDNVPEPGSLSLVLLGSWTFLHRQRRVAPRHPR